MNPCSIRQLFLQSFPQLLRADHEHAGMDLIVALVGSDDPGRPQQFEAAAVGAVACWVGLAENCWAPNSFVILMQKDKVR